MAIPWGYETREEEQSCLCLHTYQGTSSLPCPSQLIAPLETQREPDRAAHFCNCRTLGSRAGGYLSLREPEVYREILSPKTKTQNKQTKTWGEGNPYILFSNTCLPPKKKKAVYLGLSLGLLTCVIVQNKASH